MVESIEKIAPLLVLLTDTDTVATSSIPATHKASPDSRSCQGIALITFYCAVIARMVSSITYISVQWCRQSSTTFNRVISRKPVFVVSDQIRHKVGWTTTEDYKVSLYISDLFCLFGLRLYIPVNIFSVMSGWGHRFLGITSTFWEVNVSCSRIQHGDLSEDRTSDLWLKSRTLYH